MQEIRLIDGGHAIFQPFRFHAFPARSRDPRKKASDPPRVGLFGHEGKVT